MAYGCWMMYAATPEFPGCPLPTGQLIDLPTSKVFHPPAFARWRYLVQTNVVPLPSDRWTTLIAWPGSGTAELRLAMLGSFHIVRFPRKISTRTGPVRFSPVDMPGRL